MRRIVFVIFASSLLVAFASVQKESIPVVRASSLVYQGDLILVGNNVTVIEGAFNINGSIIVEENATLILRNALLNFTQVENYQFNITLGKASNGHPRLTMENATFDVSGYLFFITLKENSSATADEFTADTTGNSVHLYAYDYSHLSISNSKAPYALARLLAI